MLCRGHRSTEDIPLLPCSAEDVSLPPLPEDASTVHGLTMGVTPSPCSASAVTTPLSFTLDVATLSYSTEDALPPCSTEDVIPPPYSPCFALYIAPPIAMWRTLLLLLLCGECHSPLWPHGGQCSHHWPRGERHYPLWPHGGQRSPLWPSCTLPPLLASQWLSLCAHAPYCTSLQLCGRALST